MLLKTVKLNRLNLLMHILLVGILISLGGCSRTKEMAAVVLKDRGEDYACAKSYPPLKIPKGIARDSTTNTYHIPEG